MGGAGKDLKELNPGAPKRLYLRYILGPDMRCKAVIDH